MAGLLDHSYGDYAVAAALPPQLRAAIYPTSHSPSNSVPVWRRACSMTDAVITLSRLRYSGCVPEAI